MRVWRIARDAHAALDGEGARLYGGRWNHEGTPVVYTATSLALAALELLVHVEPLLAPADLAAFEIDVPESHGLGAVVTVADMVAEDWQTYPAPEWQADLGRHWIEDGTFLWMAVPSVIVPEEYDVLLNPQHPLMREVRVVSRRPFGFDPRLR